MAQVLGQDGLLRAHMACWRAPCIGTQASLAVPEACAGCAYRLSGTACIDTLLRTAHLQQLLCTTRKLFHICEPQCWSSGLCHDDCS